MPKAKKPSKDWTTYAELAGKLAVSDRTLRNYRKDPGFPAKGTAAEVEAWIAARGQSVGEDKTPSRLTPQEVRRRKQLASMRLMEEEARLKKMEREQQEGQLVAVPDVLARWTRVAGGLKNGLMNIGAQVRQECIELLRDPLDGGKLQDAVDERVRQALEKAIEQGAKG